MLIADVASNTPDLTMQVFLEDFQRSFKKFRFESNVVIDEGDVLTTSCIDASVSLERRTATISDEAHGKREVRLRLTNYPLCSGVIDCTVDQNQFYRLH